MTILSVSLFKNIYLFWFLLLLGVGE